jgi:hypothetical protein
MVEVYGSQQFMKESSYSLSRGGDLSEHQGGNFSERFREAHDLIKEGWRKLGFDNK